MDDPNYWRSVRDKVSGREVVLTEQQLKVVQRIQQSRFPEGSYDQYEVSTGREEEQVSMLTLSSLLPLSPSLMLTSSPGRR